MLMERVNVHLRHIVYQVLPRQGACLHLCLYRCAPDRGERSICAIAAPEGDVSSACAFQDRHKPDAAGKKWAEHHHRGAQQEAGQAGQCSTEPETASPDVVHQASCMNAARA